LNLSELLKVRIYGDILRGKLTSNMINELDTWVNYADKMKSYPEFKVLEHENAGSGYNFFQLSIPPHLVYGTLTMAAIIKLIEFETMSDMRTYGISTRSGHLDYLDLWINYSYKNNENPIHIHPNGVLSCVIYYEKCNEIPTLFDDKKIFGEKGDFIIFPSDKAHSVPINDSNEPRITFALNIKKY